MNRARVFGSVRFAATVRNTFAFTSTFGDGATAIGFTPSAGVGALSPLRVRHRCRRVWTRLLIVFGV